MILLYILYFCFFILILFLVMKNKMNINVKRKEGKMEKEAEYFIKDDTLIVRLSGDLDHHNAEIIRKKIDNLLDNNRLKNIIMDFINVGFMDSSGIGVIMGRYKRVAYQKGKIAVVGINKVVDRIFTMAALYRITEKYEDIEGAYKGLKI